MRYMAFLNRKILTKLKKEYVINVKLNLMKILFKKTI